LSQTRRILFITGTRADFGKIKTLILALQELEFDVQVFVTGMHMHSFFGSTYDEVAKAGVINIYKFINSSAGDSMDVILAKTIHGLGDFVRESRPDLIVVHGDRVEALAGAVVGGLNNILVAHIEGGEVSGTIDESIRHSISKFSHTHFVANSHAARRLAQLGERENTIYIIGSPDLDVMSSEVLPALEVVKHRYDIPSGKYGILIFHPVTTEIETLHQQAETLLNALEGARLRWIVINPNNDHGSDLIFDVYRNYQDHEMFRFYPSMRFEYFLTLLKHAEVIVGNSSTGIREAPYYGVPTINIGSRQNGRANSTSIVNIEGVRDQIIGALATCASKRFEPSHEFGDGKSTERFVKIMQRADFWRTPKQKKFIDFSDGDVH
jgi:UDP-N-acetylglucosamine 2-epimerase (hydrolysing)